MQIARLSTAEFLGLSFRSARPQIQSFSESPQICVHPECLQYYGAGEASIIASRVFPKPLTNATFMAIGSCSMLRTIRCCAKRKKVPENSSPNLASAQIVSSPATRLTFARTGDFSRYSAEPSWIGLLADARRSLETGFSLSFRLANHSWKAGAMPTYRYRSRSIWSFRLNTRYAGSDEP